MTAMKVLEAAQVAGVKIPEQVSLIGYDNIAAASYAGIQLTTVNQSRKEMGTLAVERLLQQIGGDRACTQDMLQPELTIRSSCVKRLEGDCHDRIIHGGTLSV